MKSILVKYDTILESISIRHQAYYFKINVKQFTSCTVFLATLGLQLAYKSQSTSQFDLHVSSSDIEITNWSLSYTASMDTFVGCLYVVSVYG